MSEPRKPIFGFLWPQPDPHAPLDADARQRRRVRIAGRGFIRVASLIVLTALTVSAMGSALMAGLASGFTIESLVGSALSATLVVLVLRGWVVGTYVNDDGISIETTWRRVALPWSEVKAVHTEPARAPFLGLPLPTRSICCFVTRADGTELKTHVYACSPDLWLRPEAFDAARIRLENWKDAN